MPRPRSARVNKTIYQGGHVEIYRGSDGRKYSPRRPKFEIRTDFNQETHAQCNVCGKVVRKRQDGTLFTHNRYCLGSPLPEYKPRARKRKPVPRQSPIRQWAKERGYAIAGQGRIPDHIIYAYNEAHGDG